MEISLLQLLGLLGAEALGIYGILRLRLHQIRKLIDELDDALLDDKVTENELNRIWAAVKKLFGR